MCLNSKFMMILWIHQRTRYGNKSTMDNFFREDDSRDALSFCVAADNLLNKGSCATARKTIEKKRVHSSSMGCRVIDIFGSLVRGWNRKVKASATNAYEKRKTDRFPRLQFDALSQLDIMKVCYNEKPFSCISYMQFNIIYCQFFLRILQINCAIYM